MSSFLLKYQHIPAFLHSGDFYRSLNPDDKESWIKIPVDCFKPDHKVTKLEHFTNLLRVTIFWALDDLPESLLDYCYSTKVSLWHSAVLSLTLPGEENSPLLLALLAAFGDDDGILSTMQSINHIDLELARNETVTTKAAGLGNLRMLQLLHERGFPWHEHTTNCASYYGKLDCLQYAHENGCLWDVEVYKSAIYGGHMDCLQYAHKENLPWDCEVTCVAAMEGRLEFLQYLHEQGCPWDDRVCERAAEHGHYDCLLYAHREGCTWTANTVLVAATGGHTKCLHYALINNCPIHEQRHVACLEILFETELVFDYWNVNLAIAAAYNATSDCLQYLHSTNCPWNNSVTDIAAEQGNVDMLRFAIGNGCDVSNQIVQFAASSGNLLCLKYLIDELGLHMAENGSVFVFALLRGDLECITFLLDYGCPFKGANFGENEEFEFDYDEFFCIENGANGNFAECVRLAVDTVGIVYNQQSAIWTFL